MVENENMPDIKISQAYMYYKNKKIFEDLSIFLPGGQWTAILGTSGVGKSTLLRMLAGVLSDDKVKKQSKELCVGQIETSDNLPLKGRVAYMAQDDLLMPWSSALENVLIGHSTEVKSSILLKGAKAAHFNYVGNSILGCDVNLGAGAICSNFRFDQKPIPIRLDDTVIMGPKKLGAIIGDESQIGCNSVLNPGTFLIPKSVCYPNSTVKGFNVCQI